MQNFTLLSFISGCKTQSQFDNEWTKEAWQPWQLFTPVTKTFRHNPPFNLIKLNLEHSGYRRNLPKFCTHRTHQVNRELVQTGSVFREGTFNGNSSTNSGVCVATDIDQRKRCMDKEE